MALRAAGIWQGNQFFSYCGKSLAFAPCCQPLMNVSSAGNTGEIVKTAQQLKFRQSLKNSKVERGAADASSGKAKSHQSHIGCLEVWVFVCLSGCARGRSLGRSRVLANAAFLSSLLYLHQFIFQEPFAWR